MGRIPARSRGGPVGLVCLGVSKCPGTIYDQGMSNPDSRIHPIRGDAAASYLKDRVQSPRYLDGTSRQCLSGRTALHRDADERSGRVSELLFGEAVTLYDTNDEGWAWVQSSRDGYVGYCPSAVLGEVIDPTHACLYPLAHVYREPDFSRSPVSEIYSGSPVRVLETRLSVRPSAPRIEFSYCDSLGWVVSSALRAAALSRQGALGAVRKLIGTSYLWGGRSAYGIDCSGLSQLYFSYLDMNLPRDSDQQRDWDGFAEVEPETLQGLLVGDLVFMPGHVVIASGNGNCIHAQATTMCVIEEPLERMLGQRDLGLGDTRARRLRGSGLRVPGEAS